MEEEYFGLTKKDINSLYNSTDVNKNPDELEKVSKQIKSTDNLASLLRTDIEGGIPGDETDRAIRTKTFDSNIKEKIQSLAFWYFAKQTLEDTFLRILILSAFVQISIGLSPVSENPKKDWIDGLAILFAVVVIVFTASITNYSKEKKFRKMTEEQRSMKRVLVKRRGTIMEINEEEILVGDIMKIEVGMILLADGILVKGNEVKVDESSITGESSLVRKETLEASLQVIASLNKKKECGPFVFAGTVVKSGSGWNMILAVGANSHAGKIRQTVIQNAKEDEGIKSPLEIKLEEIAEDIGKFGLIAAILTLIVLLTKLFYMKWTEYEFHKGQMEKYQEFQRLNSTIPGFHNSYNATNGYYPIYETLIQPSSIFDGIYKEVFTILVLCITIIVVAIPEGLPLAVTLALSFSVHKMMNDNNLVKTMQACETMGGANFICTDKTGTLTRNKMQVVSIFNNLNEVNVHDINGYDTVYHPEKFKDNYFSKLKECLINNLQIEIDEKSELIENSSNRTDTAFYEMFRGFIHNNSKTSYSHVHSVIGFTSERKKMSTIIKVGDGQYRIYTKGAPNLIFDSCSHYLHPSTEETTSMSSNHLNKLKEVNVSYEHKLLRCIAFGYKDINQSAVDSYKDLEQSDGSYKIEEEGFTLIGLAAISDTLRPGVEESLGLCYNAGINVIMVTGDMIDIAVSIAKKANIIRLNEDFQAMIGHDFYKQIGGVICSSCSSVVETCVCPKTVQQAKQIYGNYHHQDYYNDKICKQKIGDMRAFKKIIKNLKVIARASPMDKFALVLGLKDLDHVVAVTGDGTNDSPALSKADVGFAMGITGTDIAKDAADIIILDDNFNSIIHAIKWGRNIFNNIRKFIQFQLSVNISAVLLVFCSCCIGSESPISAIQMLWINMIMDSLGSLSLATESPTKDLLTRKPHSKREYIITPRMWKHILLQSFIQFTLVFLLYLYAPYNIIENDPTRIEITKQIENCFGKFPGEIIKYEHHEANYFILDGKKSSWDPLKLIKPNLDNTFCRFYDTRLFEPKQIGNLYQAYKWYNAEFGNTVHMTIIFNSFVFFALFNQINSRILDDSVNVFKNIHKNFFFIFIFTIEVVGQVIIIQYGGLLFKVAVGGLSLSQWLICVGLGSVSLLISILLKFIKLENIFSYDYSNILKKFCKCHKTNDDPEMNRQLVDESQNNSIDGIELAIIKSENSQHN